MKNDTHDRLDLHEAQFSQLELCEAAGITMPTANNWISTGAVRPADVGGRRIRKPRSFSLLAIYEARVAAEMVTLLGVPPLTAAAIARRTIAKGHTWHLSLSEHFARGENPLDVFGIVFWSDRCRDWDVWVEILSDRLLRIDLTAIAKERGEPRVSERPLLVLPLTRYFVSVYEACTAMIAADGMLRGAEHAE